MEYREHHISAKLRDLAACTWSVQTNEKVPDFPVRPDGCVDVILWPDGRLRVTGGMTRPHFAELAANSLFTGIRFLPGAAASVLRVPAHELTGKVILFEELQPQRAIRVLQDRLMEVGLECRHQLLAAHFESGVTPLNSVQLAIARLTADAGAGDLAGLADQTGMSPRQFRRRCLDESGLTPRLLARILRFQHALACAAERTHQTWTSIAAHCGYFDQAHLIRDFQEFAGGSPMSVLSKARTLFAG